MVAFCKDMPKSVSKLRMLYWMMMNFSLVLGFMKRNGEQSQHFPSDFTWVLRALDNI
jgi:hypothetical protein